jgi:hypothetical protein
MGLSWRRRVRLGKKTSLNLSTSGMSVTRRAGRASLSSRGNAAFRIAKGLSFRKKLW